MDVTPVNPMDVTPQVVDVLTPRFAPQNLEPTLNQKVGKRIYLLTYSQCDLIRFPTRKSFGKFAVRAFEASYARGGAPSKKVSVTHWAVCREPHEKGGYHYHVSLAMDDVKKWKAPWENMSANGVKCSISEKHDHYVSMYRYLQKTDENIFHSEGHPDLREIGSPRTAKCNAANRRRNASKKAASGKKKAPAGPEAPPPPPPQRNQRLLPHKVGQFVTDNNISSKKQLYAVAARRQAQGEEDLVRFLFSKTEKNIAELIYKAWFLKNAEKELTEDSKSRMTRLEEAQNGECVVENCRWLERALEVLTNNKIDPEAFGNAVRLSFQYGRQKFRNVMLVGRSNTAKSFLLKPLQAIFMDKLFENPSMDKYGWNGVDNAQAVFLNDFRYIKELIPWGVFLLFLEGETVNLPTPKNHHADDIRIHSSNDIPIFATCHKKIEFSKFSPDYEMETEMMDSRWKIFHFTHRIPLKDQIKMDPCGRCFAELLSYTN